MNRVRSVHNELEVSGPISIGCAQQRCVADDESENASWSPTAQSTSDRINVTTENSVVFLMGTVPQEQADTRSK